ncbi:LysR family transcriptional regulator [Maritalea mobilis]|uniref:LysR family transcriptional regulator n=1 Tax=[Roseibacterium] beibuensis TaxID=1193142 RepID=A0ABP9KWK9_9RHOB|nr:MULTISPECIES: LysR substrate-binding domain-containing protein [Alphaproteobacteria]MBY6200946.1 LysR family transcriptional regulator [Maritalea mobilis]MCS6621995.1 LysR substrate-binding domain-containing protein [Roseibacterium beibuensis]
MAYDLTSLALFRSLAELGSIAAAAARHRIAPSAASRRISELEKQAGAGLIQRHRRGVVLTEAGRLMLRHAETLAGQVARMQAELDDYAAGHKGTIRMAANTSAITQFLPEDLAEFLIANPGISIQMAEMESVEIIQAVQSGAVDLGVFSAFTDARGLQVLPYRRDTLVVCAPSDHPLSQRKSLRLRDFDGQSVVALQRQSSLQAHVDKRAADLGITIRTTVEVKSFDGVRRMVQARLGIAILPFGAVEAYLGDGSIVMIPIDEPWATRDLMIAVQSPSALSPQAEALLRTLQG